MSRLGLVGLVGVALVGGPSVLIWPVGQVFGQQASVEPEASPSDVPAGEVAVMEAPTTECAAVPLCCGKPCIRYRQRLFRSHCCRDCCPSVTTLLEVVDPCRCCAVEVPVCLPACCQNAPSVCSRRGLLGRRVVDYTWCCGYQVRVVFHRCGLITVVH
jgi:hypothetical protein